jgi:hypothetical protein
MRRDPAGIAAIDFNGSGTPGENGPTESWKTPKVALPVQPGGTAAAAGKVASNTPTRIRITILRRPTFAKSRQREAILPSRKAGAAAHARLQSDRLPGLDLVPERSCHNAGGITELVI